MEALQNGTVKNNPNLGSYRGNRKLEEKKNKVKLVRAPDFFVTRPLKDFDATGGDVSISND